MELLSTDNGLTLLKPCWEVPSHVRAFVSTRLGGVSQEPFKSLNLGNHVGDHPDDVSQNRLFIRQELPTNPIWLNQVHGTQLWTPQNPQVVADGAVTDQHQALTMMTADCLPILICDAMGDVLGACHGGWRGLSQGIIEKTMRQMVSQKGPDQPKAYISQLKVYLGPAIGPAHFEVGDDVRLAFMQMKEIYDIQSCFQSLSAPEKYLGNLFQIAKQLVLHLGVEQIYSEEICCYERADLFFSHRRDKKTGRFASFLWKTE
jgi:polyphenol oxidase